MVIIRNYKMSQQDTNSTSTMEIYKSRRILLDLMKARGYDVASHEHFSINEINSMKDNEQMDMLIKQERDDADTGRKNSIYIHYYLNKVFRPKVLTELIDELFSVTETLTKSDILYIVVKGELNDALTQSLKHIWEHDGIFVVVQPIKRLQFNIMEHSLVPVYRILTAAEDKEVRKRYNIMANTEYPDISRFDPVAQAICIRPGQVCEIIRPSKTAIRSTYYRICS